MSRTDSSKWLEAMKDEMKSMSSNKVRDLEEIPKDEIDVSLLS